MNVKVCAKNVSYDLPTTGSQSILHAGLSNGLELPYACATGTCGTCKAKLISGQVRDMWPQALGKSKLRPGSNEILLCQCVAQSDCVIDVPESVYRADPGSYASRSYDGIISKWHYLTPDCAIWNVDLEANINFDAGQFALVGLAGINGYRAYSMVNFDRWTRRLTFLTKRKINGKLTERLFSENPCGKSVQVIGPLGRATFSPSLKKNILCIAGGSGIAGIISILSRASQEGYFTQYKGSVFFGVRTMQSAFFLDELSTLKAVCGENLEIVIGFSEETATVADRASFPLLGFDSGLIHEIAFKHMGGRYNNMQVFLAGPTPLVDATIRQLVINAKVDPKCIAYDKFS